MNDPRWKPGARRRWLATATAALALAACGGGGGGIGGTGNGGTGVAYGAITGFGSVWVNGVRYDTQTAGFQLDGRSVAQSDLRVGMIARVQGGAAAGSATLVSVDSALEGRVEQLTADGFVVMGQTVVVDAGTGFELGRRPGVGDFVEVHGLASSAGVIAATYVAHESPSPAPGFEATGLVSAHDAAAASLRIGALTVQYAGADLRDMPAGSWVGMVVQVEGSACASNPVCGTLSAREVEPAGPRIAASPGAEVEGYVTALTVDGFMLGGMPVVVAAATLFEDGLRSDLVVGAKVEVEGPISAGVMTATEVEFEAGARIEADLQAVIGDRLTLVGLPGLEIQITALTVLENLASLSELRPGMHLELRGRPAGDAVVVASGLEVDSPDDEVELRGRVSASANPQLSILGVLIDTAGLPDSAFRDDDRVVGRSAFFAALSGDRAVQVKGRRSGTAVVWEELELAD